MLIIGIISTVVWLAMVPFTSTTVSSVHYIRVSVMVFLLCLMIGMSSNIDLVELYHSLFSYSPFTLIIDSILYLIGALVLVCFSPKSNSQDKLGKSESKNSSFSARAGIEIKSEYSLILMFSILGATMIISSSDLISMYVALELQSFGLYIIACLRTDWTSATHASLKYFLLGAISSAFILLGISFVYQQVGTTGFQNISSFLQAVETPGLLVKGAFSLQDPFLLVVLGLMSMLCGFMFKISAAPFHSWFADVIQGVPTYTSMVIINLPKISIFTFLFNLLSTMHTIGLTNHQLDLPQVSSCAEMFITMTTLFSLILGTVAGLMQTKLKRLLAFSTISHVGFMLIGLTAGSETGLNAIIFYLIQYTLTVVLTFIALLAYENTRTEGQVNYIADLQGAGQFYKLLTFTFVLCLFSMAGIPPITGFYAKLEVLNSSIIQNINMVFITAIICSVISAAYYIKVIKVLIFDFKNCDTALPLVRMSAIHSYTMATLTAFISLFILDPKLIINCTELVALSLYIT